MNAAWNARRDTSPPRLHTCCLSTLRMLTHGNERSTHPTSSHADLLEGWPDSFLLLLLLLLLLFFCDRGCNEEASFRINSPSLSVHCREVSCQVERGHRHRRTWRTCGFFHFGSPVIMWFRWYVEACEHFIYKWILKSGKWLFINI